MLIQFVLKSSSSDVVDVVGNLMLPIFELGDIIEQSVKEAYLINKGVIRVPTVTTVFSSHNSATSVTLNGYVLEDGGADVTSRGIAWATFYNPTTNDLIETSGTGTGDFSVTLTGLTEGTTYYARTYATNSVGTAYGNCISFTATSAVGIDENRVFTREFDVYPNPTSGITTFSFRGESSENMILTIVDLRGREVFHRDLGNLPQDEHQIVLDLSGLNDGLYNCILTGNGITLGSYKLLITH
jgi:hypothetical protein